MEMSPGRVGSETRTQRVCEGQYGVESGAQVGWRFIYQFYLETWSHHVFLVGLELAL